MKRSVLEVYTLLCEKIQFAKNDYHREKTRAYPNYKKTLRLEGEIEAYEDIKILLETSKVLEDDR